MNRILITIALLVLAAAPASAQTAITQTALASAITSPAPTTKTFSVDSATGITVGSILYIEGEVFRVTAVSGTSITALTQYRPATHLVDARVWVVPVTAQISLNPIGSCIRGTAGTFPQYSPYTVMFNLTTGDVATCNGAAGSQTWTVTNPFAVQFSAAPNTQGP